MRILYKDIIFITGVYLNWSENLHLATRRDKTRALSSTSANVHVRRASSNTTDTNEIYQT